MVCKLNFNKSVTKKTSIGEKRILSSWKLEVQLPKWKMASLNNETGMVEDQVTNKEKKKMEEIFKEAKKWDKRVQTPD